MYVVRIAHVPAPGKANDLRAALEEHSKASNAAGGSYSMWQSLFTREQTFSNQIRYESLAALEAYQASAPNDSARAARLAKVNACLARPQNLELFEVLVPAQVTANPSYVLSATHWAAAGKFGELRELLEERVRTTVTGTVGAALLTQVAAEDGRNLRLNVLFPNLAGLEENRTANRTNVSLRAFQSKLENLVEPPIRQSLNRILLPFPSR